ncbi:hypothetical protein E4U43_002728 [Claviceps pusilla]|uniref:ORP1 like protein n=1 Tax=Claviceps pusilla TaxID=123648 RepID=A0A9P7T0N2_9HYPO|nr:hypothetical protein E4U43_002728 [Claviceps pusilla]
MAAPEDEPIQSVARNGNSNEGVSSLTEHQNEGIPAPRPICTPPSPAVTASRLDYATGSGSANPSSHIAISPEEDDEEKPVCMFVDDCDTGSQLRKAISHLFGRNKTCTLKIPKMVWVYYCRKHYQRVRYRNARTYPVTQMELVETQIERLKAWSDKNQARGKGAYIKSWTLSLRKREEKRLKGSKGTNEEDDDGSAGLGASHIPSWIIDELGEGFETARVFGIAARLREEIESGVLHQVPEIEFLPDIVDDESEKDESKPARHRRQVGSISTAKQPKRKASDFGLVTELSPIHGHGDMSYQTHHSDDESMNMSPSGKRPRTVGAIGFPHLQHRGSVDLHSAYMAEALDPYLTPCYGSGAQGQAGYHHHHPPRAQNVVPKMQPLDFSHRQHQPYPAMDRHRHQGYGTTTHGHTRMSSYQDPREVSNSRALYSHHYSAPGASVGYGQQQRWAQDITMGRRKSTSPPMLPSIASQIQGNGGGLLHAHLQSGRNIASTRPQSPGPSRPLHQRSASAYTPRCRLGSVSGGLSMTGSSGGDTVYDGENRRPPSPISHDSARHGLPGYDRRECTADYGHAPQYAQQQYSYGSNYMPPPTEADASHQESAPTRHKNPSAYPNQPGQ